MKVKFKFCLLHLHVSVLPGKPVESLVDFMIWGVEEAQYDKDGVELDCSSSKYRLNGSSGYKEIQFSSLPKTTSCSQDVLRALKSF